MESRVMVKAIAARIRAAGELIDVARYTGHQAMALSRLLAVQGDLETITALLTQARTDTTMTDWEHQSLNDHALVLRQRFEEVVARV